MIISSNDMEIPLVMRNTDCCFVPILLRGSGRDRAFMLCPLSLRRFDVTSNPIKPTWIPYGSTQSAVEDLQFSLKLMTSMCRGVSLKTHEFT